MQKKDESYSFTSDDVIESSKWIRGIETRHKILNQIFLLFR
jgi:hypothetical protein